MKRTILAVLLAASVTMPAQAQEQQWVPIAEAAGGAIWEMRKGSLQLLTGGAQTLVHMVTRKRWLDGRGSIAFERKLVSVDDCNAGFGKVVTVSLDIKQRLYDNDFITDGGTVTSALAEALCLGGAYLQRTQRESSL